MAVALWPARDLTASGASVRADPTVTATTLQRMPAGALLWVATLVLSGCWTAPNANVQPKGEPRLIQGGIQVESVKEPAIVQSVDAAARTIVLTAGDGKTVTYSVGPSVANFDRIGSGDEVRATVAEELTIYLLREGRLPHAGGAPELIAINAKVLLVDPSYRLLMLQYPDGRDETFKVGLDVKLNEMAAGDGVVIRPIEALALRVEKH